MAVGSDAQAGWADGCLRRMAHTQLLGRGRPTRQHAGPWERAVRWSPSPIQPRKLWVWSSSSFCGEEDKLWGTRAKVPLRAAVDLARESGRAGSSPGVAGWWPRGQMGRMGLGRATKDKSHHLVTPNSSI